MTIRLNPYLNFDGNARAALEFYHSVLGGSLSLTQYDSFPALMSDPNEASKIMHGHLETEDGMTIMAADHPASMADAARSLLSGQAISVSGDATDRFGVDWMVMLSGQAE